MTVLYCNNCLLYVTTCEVGHFWHLPVQKCEINTGERSTEDAREWTPSKSAQRGGGSNHFCQRCPPQLCQLTSSCPSSKCVIFQMCIFSLHIHGKVHLSTTKEAASNSDFHLIFQNKPADPSRRSASELHYKLHHFFNLIRHTLCI